MTRVGKTNRSSMHSFRVRCCAFTSPRSKELLSILLSVLPSLSVPPSCPHVLLAFVFFEFP